MPSAAVQIEHVHVFEPSLVFRSPVDENAVFDGVEDGGVAHAHPGRGGAAAAARLQRLPFVEGGVVKPRGVAAKGTFDRLSADDNDVTAGR